MNAKSWLEPQKNLNFLPFWTLYKKEVSRFMRVIGQTVWTPLINSTLYLLIFGVSLGSRVQLSNSIPYLLFLIPGLVMMSMLNNAYQNTASSLVNSKFHGDLQDLRVMPLTSPQIIWAFTMGGLTRGWVVGIVTLFVGEIFCQVQLGSWLIPEHGFLLFYFSVLGAMSFSCLGVIVAFVAKSFDQVSSVSSFVILPLLYLGGVFFDLKTLHPIWQSISHANPLFYLINGFRYSLLGIIDVSIESCMLVSAITFIILYLLAYRNVTKGSYLRW